ncbi:DNA polymerase Y family protein [Streptomyces acidicola]|uniref:DNA polymerase Y family protein n=1 Tax=Streptomyces acidicola TaxID=2596892 RepID=UPI002AD4F1A5|nr:hypothetical protein [Streptomyces acidicola]
MPAASPNSSSSARSPTSGCAARLPWPAPRCSPPFTPLGRRTVIDDSPEAISAFLRPRPVRELPGVGGKSAALLGEYGLHTVADVPQHTLQRILGARAGRALHEHARGHDTTVVDPTPAPASLSTEHPFPGDELDPAAHRRILLALADDLRARLRATDQIATGVTCTIRYADLSATRRSRTLPEATQHTVLLARAVYAVYASLGLQRARVRSIALRTDALRPADRATRQLTLDGGDDKPLAIEAVADRARTRYGHQVIHPAALAISSPPPAARQWDRDGRTEDTRRRQCDIGATAAGHGGHPCRGVSMIQDGYRDLRVPDDSGRPAGEEVARLICSKSSPGAGSSGQRQLTERPTAVGLRFHTPGPRGLTPDLGHTRHWILRI